MASWTIGSVLLLWSELQSQGVKYLLTNFLNQAALEIFFYVVRTRGEYNPTPTVRQCRIAIQHNTHIRLQSSADSTNCDVDEADVLELSGVTNSGQPGLIVK